MPGTGMVDFYEKHSIDDPPTPANVTMPSVAMTGAVVGGAIGSVVGGCAGAVIGAKAGAAAAGAMAGAKFCASAGATAGAAKNLNDNGYQTAAKVIGGATTALGGLAAVSRAVDSAND
jgi:hypothetical protein